MAKLELLKPKVKELAEKLIAECKIAGHQITITQSRGKRCQEPFRFVFDHAKK